MNTVAWYEVLYTLSAFAWSVSSFYSTLVTLGDYLYALEHPTQDNTMQIDLLELGRLYIREDTSNLATGSVFLYLGIRALLLPENPASSDLWAIISGLLIFALTLYCTIISIVNRFARNKLDRSLQPSQTSLQLVRDRVKHVIRGRNIKHE
jgi:hypothetical protein